MHIDFGIWGRFNPVASAIVKSIVLEFSYAGSIHTYQSVVWSVHLCAQLFAYSGAKIT